MKPIKDIMEQYAKTAREITKDMLTKAYKFFEKNNNEAVVFIFEALVGIMRDQKKADSSSVEMYMKKFEGF